MLDAITDFWKPLKKSQAQEKNRFADLQIGSVVSFGYVPQAIISGRKFTVTAINSYQFGTDVLTSFVLARENDAEVSMIIADAQGSQYLAISRKLSTSERDRLFAGNSVQEIIKNPTVSKLNCRDNVPELKGWLVNNYKREIQGIKGFLHRADFRDGNDKLNSGEEFQYSLLGSDSSEHALEIEAYPNGRTEIYATIYRRTNDITEIIYTPSFQHPKIELPKIELISQNFAPLPVITEAEKYVEKPEIIKLPEITKLEDIDLPQLTPTPLEPKIEPETTQETKIKENKTMNMTSTMNAEPKSFGSNGQNYNGSANNNNANGIAKQEIGLMNKQLNNIGNMDGESINCDLKVANQIIEEAIRNEMRLSDVVRRIIELPVAHQESVQIPITLSDDDYSLLAIRYGIPSSDHNAIKNRIIQDLGDFSGSKRK